MSCVHCHLTESSILGIVCVKELKSEEYYGWDDLFPTYSYGNCQEKRAPNRGARLYINEKK